MAKILMVCELGAGLGPLMNLRALGHALAQRGHRVIAAVQEISGVHGLLVGTGISYLPAPRFKPRGSRPFRAPASLAHVMGNNGFADFECLSTLFAVWDTILTELKPDLVIADSAPTVLLSLRGRPIRRVVTGTGFSCPPDQSPLPSLAPREHAKTKELLNDELAMLQVVNRVLLSHARRPLDRFAELFNNVDEVILTTYEGFDYYARGVKPTYWGQWPMEIGINPIWPNGTGPKIFAYLRSFPAVEDLLRSLFKMEVPTLFLASGLDSRLQDAFSGPTLRFESRLLKLTPTAQQCDLAITNGNHGTTLRMLLQGKPCLMIPTFINELYFARKVEGMGLGRVALMQDGSSVTELLQEMLVNPQCAEKTKAFSERYADWNPKLYLTRAVERIEELARGPRPS